MTNCHRHLVSKIIVFAYCPKMRTHNQLSNKIVSILSQEDQEGLGTFLKIFILTQIGTHWLLLTILRSNQAFQQSQVRKKDFLDKTQNFHFLWSSWDIRYLLKRYHLLELGFFTQNLIMISPIFFPILLDPIQSCKRLLESQNTDIIMNEI